MKYSNFLQDNLPTNCDLWIALDQSIVSESHYVNLQSVNHITCNLIIELQSPPSPNPPARPITFTSTVTRDGGCQQPAQKPLYQPLDIQAAREQQNRDFQRQVSTSSQPRTTPTPPNPVPPWAAQQFSPKKLSKLSKLGGAGFEFGSTYATLPRKSSAVQIIIIQIWLL